MHPKEIKILIFGDSHITTRAHGISKEILEKIDEIRLNGEEKGFSYICFTGDIDSDDKIYDLIQHIGGAAEVKIVKGNMDYSLRRKIPDTETFSIDLNQNNKDPNKILKIGLIHGHFIHPRGDKLGLTNYAKKMEVNVLISGHTHAHTNSLSEDNRILLLNPGSVTAAWSFISSNLQSFQIVKLRLDTHIEIQIDTFLMRNENFEIETTKYIYLNGIFKKLK